MIADDQVPVVLRGFVGFDQPDGTPWRLIGGSCEGRRRGHPIYLTVDHREANRIASEEDGDLVYSESKEGMHFEALVRDAQLVSELQELIVNKRRLTGVSPAFTEFKSIPGSGHRIVTDAELHEFSLTGNPILGNSAVEILPLHEGMPGSMLTIALLSGLPESRLQSFKADGLVLGMTHHSAFASAVVARLMKELVDVGVKSSDAATAINAALSCSCPGFLLITKDPFSFNVITSGDGLKRAMNYLKRSPEAAINILMDCRPIMKELRTRMYGNV
jgi:prohead serine protease